MATELARSMGVVTLGTPPKQAIHSREDQCPSCFGMFLMSLLSTVSC